jgi:hypothetical protein
MLLWQNKQCAIAAGSHWGFEQLPNLKSVIFIAILQAMA